MSFTRSISTMACSSCESGYFCDVVDTSESLLNREVCIECPNDQELCEGFTRACLECFDQSKKTFYSIEEPTPNLDRDGLLDGKSCYISMNTLLIASVLLLITVVMTTVFVGYQHTHRRSHSQPNSDTTMMIIQHTDPFHRIDSHTIRSDCDSTDQLFQNLTLKLDL